MRKRLVELLESTRYWGSGTSEEIANYLLKNGVIVPPCMVGQTVYRVIKLVNGESFVKEGIVFEVSSTYENGTAKTRFYFWACGDEWDSRHYSLWCDLADFGETVFITKEEAEQALKGGEG